jgi:hypothetical protein
LRGLRALRPALVLVSVVLPSALALAAADAPLSANLDSDPALEHVVSRQLCEAPDGKFTVPPPPCSDDQFPRRRIEVEDSCNGKGYTFAISSVQDFVDRLRVTNADGRTKRPEIFFDLRSGATGRGGEAQVVRIVDERRGVCPRPRILFRYPRKSTLGPIPRGALAHDSWSPVLRDFTRHYRGKGDPDDRDIRRSQRRLLLSELRASELFPLQPPKGQIRSLSHPREPDRAVDRGAVS